MSPLPSSTRVVSLSSTIRVLLRRCTEEYAQDYEETVKDGGIGDFGTIFPSTSLDLNSFPYSATTGDFSITPAEYPTSALSGISNNLGPATPIGILGGEVRMLEELLRINLMILSTQEELLGAMLKRIQNPENRLVLRALLQTHNDAARVCVKLFHTIMTIRRRGVFNKRINPADSDKVREAMKANPIGQKQLF